MLPRVKTDDDDTNDSLSTSGFVSPKIIEEEEEEVDEEEEEEEEEDKLEVMSFSSTLYDVAEFKDMSRRIIMQQYFTDWRDALEAAK